MSGAKIIIIVQSNYVTDRSHFFVSALQTFHYFAILVNSNQNQTLGHQRLQVVKVANLELQLLDRYLNALKKITQ